MRDDEKIGVMSDGVDNTDEDEDEDEDEDDENDEDAVSYNVRKQI